MKKLWIVFLLLLIAVGMLGQTGSTLVNSSGSTTVGTNLHGGTTHAQWFHEKSRTVSFGGCADGSCGQQVFNGVSAAAVSSVTITVDGNNWIDCKVEYSATTTTSAAFQGWIKDSHATAGWSPLALITSTNIARSNPSGITTLESGYTHGIPISFNVAGYTSFKLELTNALSSGVMSSWCSVR